MAIALEAEVAHQMKKTTISGELDTINGLKRVYIKNVYPELDDGLYFVKRVVDETLVVSADIFADGFDEITAKLEYKSEHNSEWFSTSFKFINNDRWEASFNVRQMGIYEYRLIAWIDEFKTWRNALKKKIEAQVDINLDLQVGILLLKKTDKEYPPIVETFLQCLKNSARQASLLEYLDDISLEAWIEENQKPIAMTQYPKSLKVYVDRKKAAFSTWYEVFPRSLSTTENQHGTLQDLIDYLPHIKKLGFDIVYLPPIHPIGKTHRKGKNNNTNAHPDDPGSPWAIGNELGGHMAIHPSLGNFDDLNDLIEASKKLGIEIALDFALQCSPDHPYLKEHPDWFKKRPDGSLQYAENPPKKYQDIYPLYFETHNWQNLWLECQKILLFWIEKGIKIFRVDNPHTKPFIFWEWLIASIKKQHPEVLFLSEAFTRPNVMYELAKLGFSQSYTYFTWRNTKQEITDYIQELTTEPVCDFFRPNLWPNTPDILHDYLQKGGESAFKIRLMLAATLSGNYGIYGPTYEYCINEPLQHGSEEYSYSEKYEIKTWRLLKAKNISNFIARINQIRHTYQALQQTTNIQFHVIDNTEIIAFSKFEKDYLLLIIVNLDPHQQQSGFLEFKLPSKMNNVFVVHDILNEESYEWRNERHYIELSPERFPGHILLINAS